MTAYLEKLIEQQNALLETLITLQQETNQILTSGIHVKKNKEYAAKYTTQLTQEDFDMLDEEIDLDWWYASFGEDPRPAKNMNQSGAPYSKAESDYMFKRLTDIVSVSPVVNGGTHTFKYVGKKYVPHEKNTFNCFACVPVER